MPEKPDPEDVLSFEEALGQLQSIVEGLERGESDLSSALGQYERGVSLYTHCQRLLDQAEQSVALLAGVDAQGNPITTPFDATATIAREGDPSAATIAPVPETKQPKPRSEPTRSEPARSEPARPPTRKVRAAPEVDAVDPLDPPF